MSDVGLGQAITTTGRYRSRKLKDAVKDNHPLYEAMDKEGGIDNVPGGRTIVEEALSGQNSTVNWVGEAGRVSLQDYKVADAAEYSPKYQLGAVSWTLAEEFMNRGGSNLQFIKLIGAKFDALEASMMNEFHEGMLSSGTGSSGLQLTGLGALVSTTPTSGTVGGIDRSASAAAWFRNQKFDTGGDWSDGSVDAGHVKRFLDKGIDATMKMSKVQVQLGFLGQTHWEFANQAIQAIQVINDKNGEGRAGFEKLVYRGVPLYFGAGINYSGATAMTATRTYLLNVKPGGVNLRFYEGAKFDLLEELSSSDQAAKSRLMFTMAAMTIGGLAKHCWVGFD
jgi:hypothetical protein